MHFHGQPTALQALRVGNAAICSAVSRLQDSNGAASGRAQQQAARFIFLANTG